LNTGKVSVITVVYNGVHTIRFAIESVLSQDYPSLEYIVIDGGSTDGTLDILQEYKDRIHYLISEPDKGIYDAMNKGLKVCTGEWVALLNADDTYAHNQVLSKVQQCFYTTLAEAVYGDLNYVNAKGRVLRRWKSGSYNKNKFLWGWMPPHPSFFLKKKAYDHYGLFSLSLKYAADYELMLRMLFKHGLQAHYIPEVLVKMRAGGVSNASWSNRLIANMEDRKAWKMNGIHPLFFTLTLKPIRKILQVFAF